MSHRPVRPPRAIALVATLAVLACGGRGDQPSRDSTAPGRPASAAQPGALSKPIDEYSGEEFYAFTRSLAYSGGRDRDRPCTGLGSCEGDAPASRTRVRVDAVTGQDSLLPSTTPPNGVVTVRAVNRGPLAEARYRLRPDSAIQYFMIVTTNGTQWRWRLEELTTTPGARAHRSVGTGTVRGCNHPWTRGARADFRSCADGPQSDSVMRMPLMLRFVIGRPIWTGCGMGCCEYP